MFSEDTVYRLKKFWRIRRSRYSLIAIVALFVLSTFAELLANDKPVFVIRNGEIFFPFFHTYQGTEFGLDSQVEPVYKELQFSESDTVIWTPIRWGENESNSRLESYPGPPTSSNLLGTDDRGRDILTRLIYGFRVSMFFGLISVIIAVVIAVVVGAAQGYLGGWVDLGGQRIIEVWSSLPYLYVLILVVNIYEPSIPILILANAVFAWISLSYYVRAEILKVRKFSFIEAARSLGCSHTRALFKHLIPNAMTPVITFAPFIINVAINNLAVLDYLGLGVQPPTASIGELLRQGRSNFTSSWWLAVFPFIALVTTIVMINFVGEGLRETFDPRKTMN